MREGQDPEGEAVVDDGLGVMAESNMDAQPLSSLGPRKSTAAAIPSALRQPPPDGPLDAGRRGAVVYGGGVGLVWAGGGAGGSGAAGGGKKSGAGSDGRGRGALPRGREVREPAGVFHVPAGRAPGVRRGVPGFPDPVVEGPSDEPPDARPFVRFAEVPDRSADGLPGRPMDVPPAGPAGFLAPEEFRGPAGRDVPVDVFGPGDFFAPAAFFHEASQTTQAVVPALLCVSQSGQAQALMVVEALGRTDFGASHTRQVLRLGELYVAQPVHFHVGLGTTCSPFAVHGQLPLHVLVQGFRVVGSVESEPVRVGTRRTVHAGLWRRRRTEDGDGPARRVLFLACGFGSRFVLAGRRSGVRGFEPGPDSDNLKELVGVQGLFPVSGKTYHDQALDARLFHRSGRGEPEDDLDSCPRFFLDVLGLCRPAPSDRQGEVSAVRPCHLERFTTQGESGPRAHRKVAARPVPGVDRVCDS